MWPAGPIGQTRGVALRLLESPQPLVERLPADVELLAHCANVPRLLVRQDPGETGMECDAPAPKSMIILHGRPHILHVF